MPEILSIRERIMVRLFEVAGTITGVGKIRRDDLRGAPLPWDPITGAVGLILIEGDDELTETVAGTMLRTLSVEAMALVGHETGAAENTSFLHNRWSSRLEQAFLVDRYLIEPTPSNIQLATDLRVTRTAAPLLDEEGGIFVTIAIEVDYRHDDGNPFAYGTAIPQRSYTTLPAACLYPF